MSNYQLTVSPKDTPETLSKKIFEALNAGTLNEYQLSVAIKFYADTQVRKQKTE